MVRIVAHCSCGPRERIEHAASRCFRVVGTRELVGHAAEDGALLFGFHVGADIFVDAVGKVCVFCGAGGAGVEGVAGREAGIEARHAGWMLLLVILCFSFDVRVLDFRVDILKLLSGGALLVICLYKF